MSQASSFLSTLFRIRASINRWVAWLSFVAFSGCLILDALGWLIVNDVVLVSAGIAFSLSVFQILVELSGRVMSLENALTGSLPGSARLERMHVCLRHLKDELKSVSSRKRTEIDWLGLDMAHALDLVLDIVESASSKKLDLRVLIMTDNVKRLGPEPPENVVVWANHVSTSMKRLQSEISRIGERWTRSGRKLSVEVRQYSGLPFVHGFRIRQPIDIAYVSICRWEESLPHSYTWGMDEYQIVSEHDQNQAAQRTRRVFTGAFEQFWDSGEALWSYP